MVRSLPPWAHPINNINIPVRLSAHHDSRHQLGMGITAEGVPEKDTGGERQS